MRLEKKINRWMYDQIGSERQTLLINKVRLFVRNPILSLTMVAQCREEKLLKKIIIKKKKKKRRK